MDALSARRWLSGGLFSPAEPTEAEGDGLATSWLWIMTCWLDAGGLSSSSFLFVLVQPDDTLQRTLLKHVRSLNKALLTGPGPGDTW